MSSPTVQRSAPTGISVLISGAGVGGLSAALEFWRRGCEVRIFERTPTTVTAGDSFVIQPSALQWIKHWPEMKEPHDKISFEPMFAKYKQTGERVSDPVVMGELFKTKGSDKHPRLLLHSRPRFHAVLLDQVTRCGMQVEFGKEVVEYFEVTATAKGGVKLSDGSEYEADLVIAADGLRGASSNLVSGEPVPATSSKYACLRSSYPIELAFKDPKVAEHFKFQADGSSIYQSWAGANKFGVFWCSDAEIMWILTYPDNGSAKESWNNRITTEDALKFTSSIPDWSEVYDSVIRATPPNAIVDWKLMWRDPQLKWTSPAGYVVQLGDAAHSFLPTSGNGGTQAMEDAVSLAVCVVKAGKDRIPDATRVHNLLRFERVSFIQAMGIARRDAKAKADTAKMSSANWKAEIKAMPGSWLMDHDPEEYAEKNFEPALAHLIEGAPFKNTNRPVKVEYQPWTIDGLTEALAKGEPSILDGDWS